MLKIATVVGARPQFVKAAIVSRGLRLVSGMEERVIHTGQHFDPQMSDVFFRELQMPRPDYFLGIHSGTHGKQTGRMLEAIEDVLLQERPQLVIVYGDTNSTLAGALAAVKLHIPVAHVEAGLRSYNRCMPEEINRIMADHVAELLFAPTQKAMDNLRKEGIREQACFLTGDVMYDAALYFAKRAEESSSILDDLGLHPKSYVLATVHRAENTDDEKRLRILFEGLCQVASELPVVLPLHPRTSEALKRIGMWEQVARRITVIDPVGYLDMVMLEKGASLIATDSGGVQKEAYFYQVPCAVLRPETEWTELVDLQWNHLVDLHDARSVSSGILAAIGRTGKREYPFGTGDAVSKMLEVLGAAFADKGLWR